MEEILAIVFLFGGGTLFLLAVSPVGRALADRIRHGVPGPVGHDPALYEELDRLRGDVAELQERMDFTERLLAQRREVEQLPGAQKH